MRRSRKRKPSATHVLNHRISPSLIPRKNLRSSLPRTHPWTRFGGSSSPPGNALHKTDVPVESLHESGMAFGWTRLEDVRVFAHTDEGREFDAASADVPDYVAEYAVRRDDIRSPMDAPLHDAFRPPHDEHAPPRAYCTTIHSYAVSSSPSSRFSRASHVLRSISRCRAVRCLFASLMKSPSSTRFRHRSRRRPVCRPART